MNKSHCKLPGGIPGLVLILFFLASFSGCEYLKFVKQKSDLKSEFDHQPKMELLRELAPENCFTLFGELKFRPGYDGTILIVAVSDRFQHREIVAKRVLVSPFLYYSLFVPEGEYDLYVFADLNHDDFFQENELVGQTQSGKPVLVQKKYAQDAVLLQGPAIHLDMDHPQTANLPIHFHNLAHKNKYVPLDDDFFAPRFGTMGLYRPMEFLAHTQGTLFQLEKYNPKKTLVIFVHGVEGTPQDWKYLVDGLDKEKFQSWFFYYPSGLPLKNLGNMLARSIILLDQTPGYGISNLIIVAHSMGGLVARSAIDRLCRDGKPHYLKMYISLSSPYGGIEEAREGAKTAPVMVPCWLDVAAESEFLKNIYQNELPEDLPFFMFFGYRNKSGISSDGTITLRSQLDRRVYLKAVRTYGFDATHVGILNDETVKEVFNDILKTAAP